VPPATLMQTSLGVRGSASEVGRPETAQTLIEKAESLARAIAKRKVLLFTGATTGVVYLVGKTAHDEGAFHIGVHPPSTSRNMSININFRSMLAMRLSTPDLD